ncbi:hypothetical protein ILUMI_04263 [Ignelater luminosus]|uniref:Uncharacterized protein n=1 Tax=Ignelater luminosus TaxID=2038154 RepID=A0A8K0DES8_IGNLU|nr:hypothetical protein ILUMI_04263 [Ignelater luminosus]
MPSTRLDVLCPVVGVPRTFENNVLPTYADVIKCFLFNRQELLKTIKREPSIGEVSLPLITDLKADDYIHLINWNSKDKSFIITELSLTTSISDDELRKMISDVPVEIEILKFPCHSQAVERCVKLVTEASAAVCDEKRFCNDGPDNEFSYVEEGGKGVWSHPKRQSKGGGVMVWGAITSKGEYLLLRLQGKINSSKYLSMITEDVYP